MLFFGAQGMRFPLFLFLALCSSWCCSAAVTADKKDSVQPIQMYTYKVVKKYRHDKSSFTQGLECNMDTNCDTFFESTGLYNGLSHIMEVKKATGKRVKSKKLDNRFFGEGATVIGNRIYQLTWREKTIFSYAKGTLKEIRRAKWKSSNTEGWGLTNDGHNLIVSDGTATLRWVCPKTLNELKAVEVRLPDGRPVNMLNELEWIKGEIWANVWFSDNIYIINPETGNVRGIVDMSGIYKPKNDSQDVLNGIAYDPVKKEIFVTGKMWPWLYKITVVEKHVAKDEV